MDKKNQGEFQDGDYHYRLVDLPDVMKETEDMEQSQMQGAEITSYTGSGRVFRIPDELNGHPVVSIGKGAFSNLPTLIGVKLPRTTFKICQWAFERCQALDYVMTAPWTEIDRSAFWKCRDVKVMRLIEIGSFSHGKTSALVTMLDEKTNRHAAGGIDDNITKKDHEPEAE